MIGVGKKGSAHLEIIISFVLFTGFSVFLMMFLQPTQQTTLQDSILLGLKNKFFDNATISLTIAFVKKGDSATSSPACINLPSCKPNEVDGNAIEISVSDPCFYYIYTSNEFLFSTIADCTTPYNYTLGFLEKQIVYSNKSFSAMNNKYYSDYDGLKKDLGVPVSVDFSIVSSGYSMTRQISQEANVFAGTYREPVLYANGTIVNQDFIIKIW